MYMARQSIRMDCLLVGHFFQLPEAIPIIEVISIIPMLLINIHVYLILNSDRSSGNEIKANLGIRGILIRHSDLSLE